MKLLTPALWWWWRALVFLLSSNSRDTARAQDQQQQNLTILSLLPYPDPGGEQPSWDEGYTLFLAEQMAVDLLNQDPTILPDYHLHLARGDSGCNIKSKATLSFVNDTLSSPEPIVGVVGPGCSVSASTVGALTGRVALINVHIAGSLLLADREMYPYSFGTLDSTEVFVEALLTLIQHTGWRHVSALYDESRLYYYSTIRVMERRLKDRHSDLDYFSSAVYDTHIPLGSIIRNNYRVVLLFVGPDFLSKILCLAATLDMVHPVYQYIIVSRTAQEIRPVEFVYDRRTYTCDGQDIDRVIHNALVVHYQLEPLDRERDTDSGLSYREFDRMYREQVTSFQLPLHHARLNLTVRPSFWAPAFFDAVWSLGLALNASSSDVDLSQYAYSKPNQSAVIRERLRGLDYQGVSGRIQFDRDTGYARRNMAIYRIESRSSMEGVGHYSRVNDNISLTLPGGETLIDGQFASIDIVVTAPRSLGPPTLVMTALGFITVLVLQILTVHYRHSPSVKATSPRVSQLAFMGCYIQILGLVTNVCMDVYTDRLTPRVNCILWHVLNIAAAIGTTLIFGTVCVRTWRLYRIFGRFKDPGRLVSEKALITCVILFVVIDVVISMVWIWVDPFEECQLDYQMEFEEVREEGGQVVNMRRVNWIIYNCTQNHFWLWCICLVFFNVIFMSGAVILAFLTRNIPYKDFKTRGVMSLTYILTGVLGLGFAVYTILLTKHTYSVIVFRFVVMSILLNVYVYLSCFLLFLPPLFPLLHARLSRLPPVSGLLGATQSFTTSAKSPATTPQSPHFPMPMPKSD